MHPAPYALPYRGWEDASRVAREHFGVTAFRPGQRALVEAVLAGEDAMGVLPTGGGKSLAFQLPAMFLPKLVVVVSPLLALMRDQDEKLARLEVPAARLDSTLRAGEEKSALSAVARGGRDVVYVTPEGLAREAVRGALARAGVSLFVVDEAHCITSWGHDFRPAYLGLARAIDALGRPPVLALTATATREDEAEIARVLGLRVPRVVRTSVWREPLRLAVERPESEDARDARMVALVAREPGTALVYTPTVRAAERLWEMLCARGERVGRYHGELSADVRAATQAAFMDGRYRVVVATKAFGMGIDKPDVRLVVHAGLPEGVATYLQEAGRAGRDGQPARAMLLARDEDVRVHRFFARGKYAREEDVARVVDGDEGTGRKAAVVRYLVEAVGAGLGRAEVIRRVMAELDARRARDEARLADIVAYAQTARCRWRVVREHFGEDVEGDCGTCDRCAVNAARARRAS